MKHSIVKIHILKSISMELTKNVLMLRQGEQEHMYCYPEGHNKLNICTESVRYVRCGNSLLSLI